MTDVLVTGVDGFVGGHLIPKLAAHGNLNPITANRDNGDISEFTTWENLPKADIVVHLAAKTFVPESWENPLDFFRTNLTGTMNALEYCRSHNARLVFLSSYLYGAPASLPIRETAELKASNPYMFSKKSAEEACRFYADNFDVEVIVLRPFNIYGNDQDEKFLIPTIVNEILETGTVTVNDLEPKRDYIFIHDLVDAIIKAIESDLKFGIFNIGSGQSYSVAELIELVMEITGISATVQSRNIRRPNEVMNTVSDVTEAAEKLSWSPTWSMKRGLEVIIDAKKKQTTLAE